jgi:hypothetical protein
MEYAAAADAGQRELTTRVKKYPWSEWFYTRSEKKTIKGVNSNFRAN